MKNISKNIYKREDGRLILLHKFDSLRQHITYSRKVWNEQKEFVRKHWTGSTAITNGHQIGRQFPGGFKECFGEAGMPWPDGMEILEDARKSLKGIELPIPESIRRRKTWSEETGDSIDIHRLYAGVPYWRDIEGRQAQGGCPIVTVICNVGSHWGITPEEIVWRGIAALIVTDILEDAGYRVELWAAREGRSQYTRPETLLKESHGPMVEPVLVSGLAGWYYRTIVWLSYYDREEDRKLCEGLGSPMGSFSDEGIELITGQDYTGKVFCINEVYDKDACVELVKETLVQFNPAEESAVGVG